MEKNETLGQVAMYGGTVATSCAAPAAYSTESLMLMIFSALGALSAVCGLGYTVWNGNRNFKLQKQAMEINMSIRKLQALSGDKEAANG